MNSGRTVFDCEFPGLTCCQISNVPGVGPGFRALTRVDWVRFSSPDTMRQPRSIQENFPTFLVRALNQDFPLDRAQYAIDGMCFVAGHDHDTDHRDRCCPRAHHRENSDSGWLSVQLAINPENPPPRASPSRAAAEFHQGHCSPSASIPNLSTVLIGDRC